MTGEAQLAVLLRISRAKYDRQRQSFQRIVAEEGAIRAKLSRLGDMEQAARPVDHTHMQLVGADIHWQEWLSRSRRTLNMDLARVLAMKEHEQQAVKQAFGKVSALEQLAAAETKAIRRNRAKTALKHAIETAVRRSGQ